MLTKNHYADAMGGGFHYMLYTPKEVPANQKLPLVIFLHGSGERGNTDGSELERLTKHGLIKQADSGKAFPFYIAAPQCPTNQYWGSYLELLNRFLDHLIKEYPIDTDRITLTGLSMGGTGTWMWGLGNPERFAALAPVCGSGVPWYGIMLRKIPIRAFHGDLDESVSPHESLSMVAAVNRHGGNATLTLYHGVHHNAWDYAYNDELTEWLAQQSISAQNR